MTLDTAGKVHGAERHGQLLLVASVDEIRRAIGQEKQHITENGRNIACPCLWLKRSTIRKYRHQVDFVPTRFEERPYDDEATAELCKRWLLEN